MSGAGVSKPMLGLLIATVVLTAASFAVREWRESAARPAVIEGAVPMHATEPVPPGAAPDAAPAGAPSGRGVDGPRQSWPNASINAMARRGASAQPQAPTEPQAPPPPPPPPSLPPPNFQLMGRFIDGKVRYLFFVQGDKLIPVKPGQVIADGFILQSWRGDKATIVRKEDGQKFEMTLEAE